MNFNIHDEYNKCVKCGKCRSVCPVFKELNDEGASARGKVTIIQALLEQNIEPSARSKLFISQCLLCEACVSVCPNDVRTDLLILSAREMLVGKLGFDYTELSITKFGFSKTGLSFKLIHIAEKFAGKEISTRSGIFYRIPSNRLIPGIKQKAFSSSEQNIYKHRTKTGFFTGCLIDYVYHDIAADSIKLMRASDITPFIPDEQACCGLPAFSLGDRAAAKKQAEAVMDMFKDTELIVTACASCGSMLKNYYPVLFNNEKNAVEFSKRVKDITEVIDEAKINKGSDTAAVTYHDPCHLKRGMGIHKQPRNLIKKAGMEIVEMKDADRCCGLGGAFGIKHHGLSLNISEKKINSIRETNVDIVATGCPGCMINISTTAAGYGADIKVLHTVNLLAGALTNK
ncbi:MAG: (Fe-S)-binding protein [Deltaproteobacteria bacterium]|nr:(Fe-S)-binding protein [Deltaproteobacteria bacterium]